jgi:hypothetical protein
MRPDADGGQREASGFFNDRIIRQQAILPLWAYKLGNYQIFERVGV